MYPAFIIQIERTSLIKERIYGQHYLEGMGHLKSEEKTFNGNAVKHVSLDYLTYYPQDYNPEQKWPLVIFLHGAGERGNDLEKLKLQGLPKLVAEGEEFPFLMVAPQCPTDHYWPLEVDALSAFVEDIIQQLPVDTTRVYLTGLSMGGYGSWHLAEANPKAFAAVVPICGGTMPKIGFPERIKVLKSVPIWVFHGAQDNVVPLHASQELVDALKAVDGNIKFTVYPDLTHDSWTITYANSDLYQWMLKQRNTNFCMGK